MYDEYAGVMARFYDAAYAALPTLGPDVAFYRELARENPGPVLELGCGTGRVLAEIAADGSPCTGLDASAAMLERARARCGPGVELREGDMRAFALDGRYALVFSAFRAFQHLLTVEEQLACLRCARDHLAPGGLLAFDVFSPRLARMALDEEPEAEDLRFEQDGEQVVRFASAVRDRPSQTFRVTFRYERRDPASGRVLGSDRATFGMRWLHRFELEHLLVRAGFHDVVIHGDFDRSPVGADSPSYVVMARVGDPPAPLIRGLERVAIPAHSRAKETPTMKAAILTELNKDLEIRDDVGLTDLGPGEVHIKVVSSGVCHSDVSAQNGTIPSGTPCVLGHEGAGVVLEVGDGVNDLAAGDHVIVSFTPACRLCKNCLRGQANLCEAMMQMATTPHFVIDGNPVMGFTGCGTFAEEMILPQSATIKVENDIPLNVVSLIGCGVTTGVGAAINTANIKPGSSVLVIGCGGVGISAIQGARIAGAAEIVAVDTVPGKLDMAKKFGATHGVTPDDLEGAKLEVTGGEGFDYALECVGHPQTIRATYDAIRRGGTAVVVGVGRMDQKIEFTAFELFYAEKTLKGSMYGSANVRVDFDRLLRLWKQGKLDLEGMISRRIKIDEVNDAFRAMQAGEVIRSVIDYQ